MANVRTTAVTKPSVQFYQEPDTRVNIADDRLFSEEPNAAYQFTGMEEKRGGLIEKMDVIARLRTPQL